MTEDPALLGSVPAQLVDAIKLEAERRSMPLAAVVAEKLLRAGHVNPFALEPHALEIRLRCMEIASRFWVPGQPAGTFVGIAASLEQYLHAGPDKWYQGRPRPPSREPEPPAARPSPPPEPKPSPLGGGRSAPQSDGPAPEDFAKADIVALCRDLTAKAMRAGYDYGDLCSLLECNVNSFQQWEAGVLRPRPANIRKLIRARDQGFAPRQRPNGVDPERDGKAPA